MFNSRHLSRILIPALLVVLIFTACNVIASPTKDASAKSMMPNLAGYTAVDTGDVQGALTNVAAGSAALTGNLQFAALIKVADRYASCYRNAGAFEASIYTNQSNPVLSGLVMIINNKVAANPQIFLSCLNSRPPNSAQSANEPQPCANHYTYTAPGGNTYEILYAATDQTVCQAFCSSLPSCRAP